MKLRLFARREEERDLRGDVIASDLERRVALTVTIAATMFFALAAAWEMFGPILAGHYASSASMGIISENMLRWHIAAPVWEYTAKKPGPELYYCHHPFGIFWTTTVAMKLFGRHDFVCRLAPVVMSAATPVLLYKIGRAIWRPASGAAMAIAFAVLPIALAFANFNALEVPTIFWSLLMTYGLARLLRTGARRHVAVVVVGALGAINADWPGVLYVGALLAIGLLRLLAPARLERVANRRRYVAWWAITAAALGLTVAGYLFFFLESGKIGDLFGSFGMRSAGVNVPLSRVLESRRYWIEASFTPIAILLGKVALPIAILRALVLRREGELWIFAWLFAAAAQYLVFKQGADVHIFWPHYFAAYFAFAIGILVATLTSALEFAAKKLASPTTRGGVIALALFAIPLAFVLRDGLPTLVYARGTGGRFNEKGNYIESDGDRTAALEWFSSAVPKSVPFDLSDSMRPTWAQVWELGGRLVGVNKAPPAKSGSSSPFVADTRFLADDAQRDLAQRFHVVAVGSVWKVVASELPAPIDAFSFDEREPSFFEWYFVSGTEPHREVVADPFATWELRHHFNQAGAPPSVAPRTLDERRIAHNAFIAANETAKAEAIEREMMSELTAVHAKLDGGVEIVGTRYRDGARPTLLVILRAPGPLGSDVELSVRAKVIAKATLSPTMIDPVEREVGPPFAIAPSRWRPGFLYASSIPIRKRLGVETFRGALASRGHAPSASSIELLTLR